MRRLFGSVAALVVSALSPSSPRLPNALHAQQTEVRLAGEWIVTRDPFADLWFHSLAVIGYEGYGPLGLYDARYAERVVAAKTRAHVKTTLDRRAVALRDRLTADSAFEVLHFLPLYFVGQDPTLVLAALRNAIRSDVPGSGRRSPRSAATIIAAALPTAQERGVMSALIDAVEDEWVAFLRVDRMSHATQDRSNAQALQSAWNERFAPVLQAYLTAMSIERGRILISPAIGTEGRFVREANGAVIIVVSSDPSTAGHAALQALVSQLTFPLLDQLHTPLSAATPRVAAAQARDAAAVRAGAILLDALDAPLAAEYRRHFVDAIGGRSFERAYPLSNEAEMELKRLVTSAIRGAASGRTSYENY